MITRLFPLLVANPLCVDMDGAPVSYESYEFSPRQVRRVLVPCGRPTQSTRLAPQHQQVQYLLGSRHNDVEAVCFFA